MLPTKEASRIHLLIANPPDSRPIWTKLKLMENPLGNTKHMAEYDPQHLYFTSEDDIKEGDWYIHPFEDKVEKTEWAHIVTLMNQLPKAQKIIASTDPSLGLPAIPESFLKQYVESNGKIDKVQLQTCCLYGGKCPSKGAYDKQHLCKIGFELTDNNEVIVDTSVHCVKPTTILGRSSQVVMQISSGIEPQYQSEYKCVFDKALEDAAENRYKTVPEKTKWICKDSFKHGAQWQKEQCDSILRDCILALNENSGNSKLVEKIKAILQK